MHYILGVDGGNSKTYAVVINEQGLRCGHGVSGCGNHQVQSMESTLNNIKEAIDQALSEAQLTYKDIHFTQYGLAGADREKDFAILRPVLDKLPFSSWDVVCDTIEGLRTGSMTNTGVVLVCGAGTNAAGRNKSGKTIQTGGFGYLFGDAAGGNDMAIETFRAAVRSWEYREEPSVLQEKIAQFHGFSSMEEVFNHYLDHDLDEVPSELTLLLHEAAEERDSLAIRLLKKTGRELGIAANSVIRRLGGIDEEPIPIVLTGSVLQKGKSKDLLEALRSTIEQKNTEIEIVIPEIEPVYGAAMLAMDHIGIRVTKDITQKFMVYGGYDDFANQVKSPC